MPLFFAVVVWYHFEISCFRTALCVFLKLCISFECMKCLAHFCPFCEKVRHAPFAWRKSQSKWAHFVKESKSLQEFAINTDWVCLSSILHTQNSYISLCTKPNKHWCLRTFSWVRLIANIWCDLFTILSVGGRLDSLCSFMI